MMKCCSYHIKNQVTELQQHDLVYKSIISLQCTYNYSVCCAIFCRNLLKIGTTSDFRRRYLKFDAVTNQLYFRVVTGGRVYGNYRKYPNTVETPYLYRYSIYD
jgi:hypothetical protein